MAKYYYVNGHTITEFYSGMICWVVDGGTCYYHLEQLASACGVSLDEIMERVMVR